MLRIFYGPAAAAITVLWVLIRCLVNLRQGHFSWKRELQMIPVLLCILLVTRFTIFPVHRVNGQIQPLLLDLAKMFPPRIRRTPLVYLFAYSDKRIAWLNFIGNILLFIPIGFLWPSVFKQLDTPWKNMAAGAGYSLLIEILQLFCYTRLTDIDDVILNTLGYAAGYCIFLLAKRFFRCRNHKQS